MNGFETVQNEMMAYDPERDGVWLHDGSDPVVFIPRNTIIGMIGHLPADPPHSKKQER